MVATYHTATPRSRTMQVAGDALRRLVEKIDAGIAVSEPARDVVVRHLGRDPVVIPNGFDHASFLADTGPDRAVGPVARRRPAADHLPRSAGRAAEGPAGAAGRPAGHPGGARRRRDVPGRPRNRTRPGRGADRAAACSAASTSGPSATLLARTDVFVAPQVARESFGIVVLEALAAGAEVVASDLPAFVDLLPQRRTAPAGWSVPAWRCGRPRRRRRRRAARRRTPPAPRRRAHDPVRLGAGRPGHRPGVRGGRARLRGPPSEPDQRDRVRRTWTALDDALIRRARRAIEVAGRRRPRPERAAGAPGRRRRAGGRDRRRTAAPSGAGGE